MKRKIIRYIALMMLLLLQVTCTEPYEIETIDYENVLVVESTITSELKHQTVKVSRTSALEEPGGNIENNATVSVESSNGTIFNFSQDNETGDYISDEEFQAETSLSYTLSITTQDGKNYSSSPVILPAGVEIESVYAETYLDDEKEGIQVYVDTYDPSGNAKYFRYEYIETYKIVTPYPTYVEAEIINYDPVADTYDVQMTPRDPEIICYSSFNSNGIIQTATTDLTEDRIVHFPVRFIEKDNSFIRDRYSILVKQFAQSVEAYTFYSIINELGSVESLLSENQPGYVAGNIISVADPDEKVLGFFEASTVTSKRIFFNYADFGYEQPPYVFGNCDVRELDYRDNTVLDRDPDDRKILREFITLYNYHLLESIHPIYTIVRQECSYCTSFSSNVRPDFWED